MLKAIAPLGAAFQEGYSMRTWWFLAIIVGISAVSTGCGTSADSAKDRETGTRVGRRTPAGGLDYDSYSSSRGQRRLQAAEDQEDAEQDRSSTEEELTSLRGQRESRTTRRPPTGRSNRLSGLEDEEPEEAMLEAKRSTNVTKDDYFKLGSPGRLDEESLEEDQAASDILADDEEDPRRR